MTDNTTLDAAVLSGMMAVGGHPTNDEQRRTYARALIAKLLEGMDGKDFPPITPRGMVYGFNAAITEIRRRVGIEGGES